MQQRNVDVAVIGAGTAGLGAYRMAKKHTNSVVLIEAGPYGTTCARVGCMPSKLLIAAANVAHRMQDSEAFGIASNGLKIDGKAVMDRVKHERDHFVQGVLDSVARIPDTDKLDGHARFTGPHTLTIGNHTQLHVERVVIATGSHSSYPKSFTAAGDRLVVNDDVFEWDRLPDSVAVFGPGVIGLELGQALHRLGVRVRMFGIGGAIGPFSDDTLLTCADLVFNEEFYLDPNAETSIQGDEKGVSIDFVDRHSGEQCSERFDYLLAATGRTANLAGLDIEHAGLALNDSGVPYYDDYTLQCQAADGSPSHIFIVGDANQDSPLLHEASDEGRIAGNNAGRFPKVRAEQRRAPLSIVFSSPQIAIVGQGYKALQKSHGDALISGEVSFANQGRSRVLRKNQGMLRVYGERGSGLFLGAEILGPQAEHYAHLLAWSLQLRLSVSQMLEMPFYHPTIEEGVRTALRDLSANLELGSRIEDHCMECGPGD